MDTASTATSRPLNRAVTLVCIQCGYPLKGLARDGVCPECSTPVRRSTAALVHFPSMKRIPGAMRASKFLLASFGFAGAACVVVLIAINSGANPILGLAGIASVVGWWAAWHLGWILLTLSDPTIAPRARTPRLNHAILIVALVSAVAPLILGGVASLAIIAQSAAASNSQPASALSVFSFNISLGLIPLIVLMQVAVGAPLLARMAASVMRTNDAARRPHQLWTVRVAALEALWVLLTTGLLSAGPGPLEEAMIVPLLSALGVTSLGLAALLFGAIASAMTAMVAAREEPLIDEPIVHASTEAAP